jgi:hypothetical protein
MGHPPNSIRTVGLRNHVDGGKAVQNGRGYLEFVTYLENGDEFGQAMTISRLMIAFKKSRPTMTKWIQQYCADEGIPYPDDLAELLLKNRKV